MTTRDPSRSAISLVVVIISEAELDFPGLYLDLKSRLGRLGALLQHMLLGTGSSIGRRTGLLIVETISRMTRVLSSDRCSSLCRVSARNHKSRMYLYDFESFYRLIQRTCWIGLSFSELESAGDKGMRYT